MRTWCGKYVSFESTKRSELDQLLIRPVPPSIIWMHGRLWNCLTQAQCALYLHFFLPGRSLFFPTFRDLEPIQSQNNCGVFCFLLYKAGSLEEMVWTALKSTLCAPFSGPANLATGPKPALGSKFSLEAPEMTICLCVIPCGKKVHFIGWGQRSVVGKPTSLCCQKRAQLLKGSK